MSSPFDNPSLFQEPNILPLQPVKRRLHILISAEILKTYIFQQLLCLFYVCPKLFRPVAVAADSQDLSSQITVKLQDICGRHGILKSVSVRRSIDLDPLSFCNNDFQDFSAMGFIFSKG